MISYICVFHSWKIGYFSDRWSVDGYGLECFTRICVCTCKMNCVQVSENARAPTCGRKRCWSSAYSYCFSTHLLNKQLIVFAAFYTQSACIHMLVTSKTHVHHCFMHECHTPRLEDIKTLYVSFIKADLKMMLLQCLGWAYEKRKS